MKKMKKILAAAMALVMLLCIAPITVSASGEPTAVYVGEFDKTRDNLVDLLREKGPLIRVKSVRNDENFYEFTYEDGVGYVLTFFNGYEMSDVIQRRSCALYADGDLTVRLDVSESYKRKYPGQNANIKFDLNEEYPDPQDPDSMIDTTYTNGWVVDGTLTIECINRIGSKAKLSIDASFEQDDKTSIGIKAQMLLLNNVVLNVNGGNIGVDATDTIGMINSTLNANMNDKLKDGDDRLFTYSIRTENLLEAHSAISERGDIRLKAYWGSSDEDNDNSGMERDPHAYSYDYSFYVTPGYINGTAVKSKKLNWRAGFNMFYNLSAIPKCVSVYSPGEIGVRPITGKEYTFHRIQVSGNRATVHRPTDASGVVLEQRLNCGSAYYVMDTCRVIGVLRWWQVVPYYLSFDWVN